MMKRLSMRIYFLSWVFWNMTMLLIIVIILYILDYWFIILFIEVIMVGLVHLLLVFLIDQAWLL